MKQEPEKYLEEHFFPLFSNCRAKSVRFSGIEELIVPFAPFSYRFKQIAELIVPHVVEKVRKRKNHLKGVGKYS
jgi:hypothetical protein